MALWSAVTINAASFLALLADSVSTGPALVWITLLVALAGSFVFEAAYRRRHATARQR